MICRWRKDQLFADADRQKENDDKQLLDEVFVICGIFNVEVRVISLDSSYRDIDNFAYHKN